MLVGVYHRSPFSISCGKWNKIECFQFPKLGRLCGRINLIHYIWVQRANDILPRSLLRIFPGHPLKKEGVSCTEDHYLPVSSFYRAFRADSGIHVSVWCAPAELLKKPKCVYHSFNSLWSPQILHQQTLRIIKSHKSGRNLKN